MRGTDGPPPRHRRAGERRWRGCATGWPRPTACWPSLGELAGEAATALGLGDVDGLGRMFDAAHGLLAGLRLSTPELETLVGAARAAGAVGAKLTGAGGGGAVIAIAPGHERDVLARWKAAGYAGFVAEIAASSTAGISAASAPRGRL